MNTNLRFVFSFWLFFGIFSVTAQNNYWKKTEANRLSALPKKPRISHPKKFLTYTLNIKAFKAALKKAPLNSARSEKSRFIMEFPNAKGKFEKFKVTKSPIMQKGLAKRYPHRAVLGNVKIK